LKESTTKKNYMIEIEVLELGGKAIRGTITFN